MSNPPPPPKRKKPPPPPEAPRVKPTGSIGDLWTKCSACVDGQWHRGLVDLTKPPTTLTIERIHEARAKYGAAFMADAKTGPYYTVLDATDSQFKTIWGGHIEAGARGLLYRETVKRKTPPPPRKKQAKDRSPPPPPKKGKKKRPPPPP